MQGSTRKEVPNSTYILYFSSDSRQCSSGQAATSGNVPVEHSDTTTADTSSSNKITTSLVKTESHSHDGKSTQVVVHIPSWSEEGAVGVVEPCHEQHGEARYLLSPFFLRQILIGTRIKPSDTDAIVTVLRRVLEKRSTTELTQHELEDILFGIMAENFYYPRDPYQEDFNILSRFYAARGALVVVIFGVPCIEPCPIIMRLAEAISIPNVVPAQLVANVLSYPKVSQLLPVGHDEATITSNFQDMCRTVHNGLMGDFEKAKSSGKSVLVQGFFVDPALYNFGQSAEHIFRDAKLPVVVIPFLLKGLLHPRQIRKICQVASVTPAACEKTLQTIYRYTKSYADHVNVIHLDGTDDINEATLDRMHLHVLRHLRLAHRARLF